MESRDTLIMVVFSECREYASRVGFEAWKTDGYKDRPFQRAESYPTVEAARAAASEWLAEREAYTEPSEWRGFPDSVIYRKATIIRTREGLSLWHEYVDNNAGLLAKFDRDFAEWCDREGL